MDVYVVIHNAVGISPLFDSVLAVGLDAGSLRPDAWAAHVLHAKLFTSPSLADSLSPKLWTLTSMVKKTESDINKRWYQYYLEPVRDYMSKYAYMQNGFIRLDMPAGDAFRFHLGTLHAQKI